MIAYTQQDQSPKLKIKAGLQLINHGKKNNDRQVFNIGVEMKDAGNRELIQLDKPLQEIGGLFIDE